MEKAGRKVNRMKKTLISIFFICLYMININACSAEDVFYNKKTHKYHNMYCRYVQKCTVNCIKIDKKEAKRRGGIPCKVCGG